MTLFPGSIYGGLAQLGASAKVAAAVPWYLSGGVAAANCLAAYQPKGAADYATSKVNLVTPGTGNATDGTAYPTWDATNGWKFLKTSSQYLLTGVIPSGGYSMIIRYSDCGYGVLAGIRGDPRFYIYPQTANMLDFNYGNLSYYRHGICPAAAVVCIAGKDAYLNGTDIGDALTLEGNPATWSGEITKHITIGAIHRETGIIDIFATAYIQALAIYNTTLTAPQVAAISTAMAAL